MKQKTSTTKLITLMGELQMPKSVTKNKWILFFIISSVTPILFLLLYLAYPYSTTLNENYYATFIVNFIQNDYMSLITPLLFPYIVTIIFYIHDKYVSKKSNFTTKIKAIFIQIILAIIYLTLYFTLRLE